MDEIKLTRDADALICILYKEYLQRRKDGLPKRNAMNFGSSPDIHEKFMPKWLFEDVDDTCRELSRAGLLNCVFADNITFRVSLTENAVIYMENRFKDGFTSVINHLKELMTLIPWEVVI